MSKVVENNVYSQIVNHFSFNRHKSTFSGISGITVINPNSNTQENHYVRMFGNLQSGYINIRIDNCADICFTPSAGVIMHILNLVRYMHKEIAANYDVYSELVDFVQNYRYKSEYNSEYNMYW